MERIGADAELSSLNADSPKRRSLKELFASLSPMGQVTFLVAVAFTLFEVWANTMALLPDMTRNVIHLGFVLILIFLSSLKSNVETPSTGGNQARRVLGIIANTVFVVASIAVVLYQIDAYRDIYEGGSALMYRGTDLIFGGLALFILFEATRRAVGPLIPILGVLALAYLHYGPYFPGTFGHRGIPWERILFRMYLSDEGILGLLLSISSTYIFVFILFGAFLELSGASAAFRNLALAVAGRLPGGPAQVAVVGSGLVGSISGSSVANVMTTGIMTIPLMRRLGYSPAFAGGVEAAASTGGMIMPPVMGATAFVMAGFLGVPYIEIVKAGFLPALLYYVAVAIAVTLYARRHGLKGLPPEEVPPLAKVIKGQGLLVVPLFVIIYCLVIGRTATFAGFMGMLSVLLIAFLRREARPTLAAVLQALESSAMRAVPIAAVCAVSGIIIGTANMTGVGNILAHNLLELAGGSLLLTLLLAGLISIIFGMGLPATGVYIMVITVLGPALATLNVLPLAGHFFVFWFGVLAALTPPVALASYAAASLAEADFNKTSLAALSLALPGYIIPFVFVYNPALLMQDVTLLLGLRVTATALLGAFCLAVSLQGFLYGPLGVVGRVLFLACGFMLIGADWVTDLIGLCLVIILFFAHRHRYVHSSRGHRPAIGRPV